MERLIRLEFKPTEFKELQDKIWSYSWENQDIDFALLDFLEEHISEEDNEYLTEWYKQYNLEETKEILKRNNVNQQQE